MLASAAGGGDAGRLRQDSGGVRDALQGHNNNNNNNILYIIILYYIILYYITAAR